MRIRFDEQLQQLNMELICMGALCEEAIQGVLNALNQDDVAHLDEVHRSEMEIDQKEREIESLCMKLLLHQQPVASDLRSISSALKMISDMERIGDQASDIADIAKYIIGSDMKSKVHLQEMGEAVARMVTDSVDSFVKKDLQLAHTVMKNDDIVDDYFSKIKDELIALLRTEPENGGSGIDILMVAKYLERIGDHAVNIAEWVEYSIIGQHRKEATTDDLLSGR